MKIRKILLTGAIAVLAACAPKTVEVEGGLIAGVSSESKGVVVYKGIPYASAPVGDLRWKAPQDVMPWEGIRECDSFGNAAYQSGSTPGEFYWHEYYTEGDPTFSEDCLYLNVWVPKGSRKGLPVAVWFHGGAFQSGWSFEKEFDGDEWAKRGVILVTVEYRLGPFGYLNHPELIAENPGIAGNYGTLDQIKSLEWVRDNISAFGGDPSNVTIFGQSAGAMAVRILCSSPMSKGLFHKAIIQSSGFYSAYDAFLYDVRDDQTAAAIGKMEMDAVGLSTLEQMREASAETLLSSVEAVRPALKVPLINWPCTNGSVVPVTSQTAIAEGSFADVPIMIGGCKDDMIGLGTGMEIFASEHSKISDNPVYIYMFDRELPGEMPAKAFHSAELWYTFGTLGRSSRPFTKEDYLLSSRMLDCWTDFAKYGNPGEGWEAWTPENDNVIHFDIALERGETDNAINAGIDSVVAITSAHPYSAFYKVESVMVLRKGKVVAERWFNGATPQTPHKMYSVSKTFTAAAIGLLIDEGKLSLDTRLVDIFPEDCPEQVSENLAAMDVRSLLTMTCGHSAEPIETQRLGGLEFSISVKGADNGKTWTQAFLEWPVDYRPGEHFLYNSTGSYMLSAIVTKISGQTVKDYLKDRLFDPIGINTPEWEESPEGISCGGWGLCLRTEDMARFGQLLLQEGKWEGRQVLPSSWVKEMSSVQKDSSPAGTPIEKRDSLGITKENSDWAQGYGYQMWITRNNGYRADGSNGQYIMVFPDKEAIVVITSTSLFYQEYLDLYWKYVFPNI